MVQVVNTVGCLMMCDTGRSKCISIMRDHIQHVLRQERVTPFPW